MISHITAIIIVGSNIYIHYRMINNFELFFFRLEPPDPPVNLEVVEVGSRSVKLSWQPPFDGHSKLLGYTVQYKASPPLGRGEVTDWQHANTLNLSISAVETGGLAMGYCVSPSFICIQVGSDSHFHRQNSHKSFVGQIKFLVGQMCHA
jgi:hypothetical protein